MSAKGYLLIILIGFVIGIIPAFSGDFNGATFLGLSIIVFTTFAYIRKNGLS
jgi:hypothetical protein